MATEKTAEPNSAGRISRLQLLVLFSVTLAGVSGATLVPPSIPAMANSLGVSSTTGALVLSAYSAPGIAVAPMVGLLADRFGRKAVMVPALLLQGLGGGFCAFAPNLKTLLFFRLIQGIGSAGLVNLVVVTLGDLVTGIDRTRYIGYNAAVLTVGATTFPSLGGLLASKNWRFVYIPFWVVFLIAVGAASILSNNRGYAAIDEGEAAGNARFFGNIRRVLEVPALRRIMLRGFVLFVLIFGGILASTPVMLEERLGAGPATIGLFLTAGSLASMTMSISAGRLRQRMSPPQILLMAFPAYALGMSFLAWASLASNRLLAFVAIALCGVGEGAALVTLQTRATEVAPAGLRATSVAMFVSSARLGQTSGPVIAKAGLDRLGYAISFAGFAVVAALMTLEQLRRTLRIKGESNEIETAG